MRNLPVTLSNVLLAALLSSPGAEAAGMPGHESSVMAVLEDRRMAWVNPARITAPGEAGMDLGWSYTTPAMEFLARLHFPRNVSFAYEGSRVESYDSYYSPRYFGGYRQLSNFFHTFALAKTEFGSSPWLSGLSLGLATRYAYDLEVYRQDYGEEEILENIWTLEAGMAWKLPVLAPWGDLTLGLFSLQTSTRLAADRMEGTQARWMDASGIWDISGVLILDYPQYGWEMDPYRRPQSLNGTHSLALTFHPGRWDLGAVAFPTNQMAGAKVRWKPETPTLLHRISLGLELYAGGAGWSHRPANFLTGGISLEADFRAPNAEAVARNYEAYRRRKAEASPGHRPDSESAAPSATTSPVQAQVPPDQALLSEAQWRENMAAFERERIGTFRGVVWPYVNTFGYVTTLLVPAGTSSLAVGETVPGFTMLLLWCGLFASTAFDSDSEEFGPMAVTYLVAQPTLKLVDFYLARRHVKRHNRALKEKYRLTLQPQPRVDGAGAVALLAF